jgi:uncharacterized protein YfaP (DUF2135 family)
MNTIFLRPVLHGLLWLLFLFSAASGATPTINWTPPSVTQKVATGQTITVPVTFTASENISNAVVRVVPALAPFVATNPKTFTSIPKGQARTLTLTISAAATSPLGTFDGTIQLKSSGKSDTTFAKPLPVTVTVTKPPEAIFSPGTDTIVTSKSIDAYGGTITTQNTGTPIDGITVFVQPGTLKKTTTFSVGYNTGNLSLPSGTPSGVILNIDGGGVKEFINPITITAPFNGDMTVMPVPFYIDHSGKLHAVQLINIDRTSKTFSFQTFHASWFTWAIVEIVGSNRVFDTSFKPENDGFTVVNNGSDYNRRGECFALPAFADWYFETHSHTDGKFYPKYMYLVGKDARNQDLYGQDIIATRAYISTMQKWEQYAPQVRNQSNLSDAEQVAYIQASLVDTGRPALLYLSDSQIRSDRIHAILAYGFESGAAGIKFHVYDPNHPYDATKPADSDRYLLYNNVTNTTDNYDEWASAVFLAEGALYYEENFQNILADADAFFQSPGAIINLASHTSGQTVQTNNITLSGIIDSSQVLVTNLWVTVGSTTYGSSVEPNGAFNIPIFLNSGINHIEFLTKGEDIHGNSILVSSKLATNDFDFVINSEVPHAKLLMTLTWNTNDTDLDTYVIDPTGDYSAYYHMVTADGGALDRDDVDGYGPEHWTLLSTDTVRYDQPYKFRVHYFSDHGNGPSNYTVTITLDQGTPLETTQTYSGNLAVSNPGNDAPDGQGADWADIATISIPQPTQQNRDQALLLPASTSQTISNSDSNIVITAPVPPIDQRARFKEQ